MAIGLFKTTDYFPAPIAVLVNKERFLIAAQKSKDAFFLKMFLSIPIGYFVLNPIIRQSVNP